MKKNYFRLFALLISSVAAAQPQFEAINCFQVNDSSKLGYALVTDTYESFVSQTGSNYTWDFSNTGAPGPWTSWTNPTASYLFQPASQSTHTTFATSEINELVYLAFGRDLFYTYSSDQDTLYYDGLYISNNYPYKPRVPYLSFPLNFNDSIYTNTQQYANYTQPTVATGSVTRYWLYDGFGTVKFPYGTATNVYRIRTKQVDSNFIINTANIFEEMMWFRQSDGIPVLRFQKNGTLVNAYYASAEAASAIEDIANNEQHTHVYPNPFSNNISILLPKGEKGKQINVYNCQGQKIISESWPANNSIDTEMLDKGIYIVEVIGSNSSFRKKMIK